MEVFISTLILIGVIAMTEVKARNGTSKMHQSVVDKIEQIKLIYKK